MSLSNGRASNGAEQCLFPTENHPSKMCVADWNLPLAMDLKDKLIHSLFPIPRKCDRVTTSLK